MEKEYNKNNNITLNEGHIKFIGFMILFLLLNFNKGSSKRLNLKEIDEIEIEKKCKLLNRVKSYMNKEEQYILHRAEVILQIIGKTKFLLEGPQLNTAEVEYHSLSLEERRKNMLLDLSKHMEEEHREIIYTAIDLDTKARTIEKKIRELNELSKSGINVESIGRFIEVIEPLLEGEIRDRTKEIKKITGMLKVIKSIDEKGSLNEMDFIEILSTYIPPQQRDSLIKMMQIAKAVSSTINNPVSKETTEQGDTPKQILSTMGERERKELPEKTEGNFDDFIENKREEEKVERNLSDY